MSENVRQKKARSVADKDGKTLRRKPQQQTSGTSISSVTLRPATKNPNTMLAYASKLPTTYQPRRGEIFQGLYIAHFISLQDTSVHPWITELPKIASNPSDQSEVYGIRAATMALYGRMSGNKDLELEGSKWYSKGLDAQREILSVAAKTQSYQPCIHRAVGAALMFSYFESIICTMPTGWMHHYIAATKMFEIAGPENCQTGLMHTFFRSVRVAAFTTSLTLDEPSTLASEIWCTVPFLQAVKTPFDKLVDVLLQLPTCLPIRNELRKLQQTNSTTSERLRRYLDTTAKHLLNRLDEFWQEHKDEIDLHYDQRIQEIALHIISQQGALQPVPYFRKFKSSPDAYLTSMYDAGKLIVLGFLRAASLVPDSYIQSIVIHGASILASVAYCETQGLFNGVSFSMVLPIKLVCLISPCEEQRTLAQIALLKWGSGRALTGICGVAAPSYLDRSHG